jgi:hypothetical protein
MCADSDELTRKELVCLQVLKQRAEGYLQEQVDKAVVTVPAHFDTEQRLATMSAAHLAGIEGVCLLQVCPDSPLCMPCQHALLKLSRVCQLRRCGVILLGYACQ